MKWKKIISTKSVLLVLLLAAAVMAVPVSATNGLITISEPIDSGNIHLGGINVGLIDDIIERTNSSAQLTSVEKEERMSELIRIKTIFPNVTEEDMILIRAAMSDIVEEIDQLNPTITPYWGGYDPSDGNSDGAPHNDMAREACLSIGVSTQYANIAGLYAKEPDTWDFGLHTIHHYANEAPGLAQDYADEAKTLISQSQMDEGYRKLAHSLHMVSDMSMPYHTQLNNLIRHTTYETYVNENWRGGEQYYQSMISDPYRYVVTDVEAAATNLANSVNPYLSTVDYIMGTNQNTWSTNTDLISITETCFREGIRYCRGTAYYVVY